MIKIDLNNNSLEEIGTTQYYGSIRLSNQERTSSAPSSSSINPVSNCIWEDYDESELYEQIQQMFYRYNEITTYIEVLDKIFGDIKIRKIILEELFGKEDK